MIDEYMHCQSFALASCSELMGSCRHCLLHSLKKAPGRLKALAVYISSSCLLFQGALFKCQYWFVKHEPSWGEKVITVHIWCFYRRDEELPDCSAVLSLLSLCLFSSRLTPSSPTIPIAYSSMCQKATRMKGSWLSHGHLAAWSEEPVHLMCQEPEPWMAAQGNVWCVQFSEPVMGCPLNLDLKLNLLVDQTHLRASLGYFRLWRLLIALEGMVAVWVLSYFLSTFNNGIYQDLATEMFAPIS